MFSFASYYGDRSTAPVRLWINEQCFKRGCEMNQTQKTSTPSEGMPWRVQRRTAPAAAGLRCTPTLEAKACATSQTAHRITPFPFLDAMDRERAQSICLYGPCTRSAIDVSGCAACPLLEKKIDGHGALHPPACPSFRRLRVVGSSRRCRGRICPAAAWADHPHGAHGARLPPSAGRLLPCSRSTPCFRAADGNGW